MIWCQWELECRAKGPRLSFMLTDDGNSRLYRIITGFICRNCIRARSCLPGANCETKNWIYEHGESASCVYPIWGKYESDGLITYTDLVSPRLYPWTESPAAGVLLLVETSLGCSHPATATAVGRRPPDGPHLGARPSAQALAEYCKCSDLHSCGM